MLNLHILHKNELNIINHRLKCKLRKNVRGNDQNLGLGELLDLV